ncbi:hypothetical protein PUN28_004823 [Cardiocondyla obscurior]|uniref:Uncharacterized protein n=1 Tax=Cardiocondyla obscurior TaxID=286306 RepID=A0AAW2GCS1_9HYME
MSCKFSITIAIKCTKYIGGAVRRQNLLQYIYNFCAGAPRMEFSINFSKKAVRDFSNNGVASKCAFIRYCYRCRYYYTKIHEILKSLLSISFTALELLRCHFVVNDHRAFSHEASILSLHYSSSFLILINISSVFALYSFVL